MKLKGIHVATFLLFLTLRTGAHLTPAGPGLSVNGLSLEFHRVAVPSSEVLQQELPEGTPLDDFISRVATGNSSQVVGVHVGELFSFPVEQQPADDPAYVSSQSGVVTQFAMASLNGTTGLLAHNNLAGVFFDDLAPGQQIDLIYGDGSVQHFLVTSIFRYQALEPNSPYSDFFDLDNGGPLISAAQLFSQIYGGENQLVLQTCLSNNGNSSWGRLFVTAIPYEPFEKAEHMPLVYH